MLLMNLNRKISLTNPRSSYFVLALIVALFGIIFTYLQLTPANLGHSIGAKDQLYATLTALATILFCGRIIILYLLPKRDWRVWANQHVGHYSHPFDLQIQPYGMVLDMLEGTDEISGKPFAIMRAVQTISNWPTTGRLSFAVRRFAILAEPGRAFSSTSKNGDDLKILAAKHYYMHVPTHQEMIELSAKK
jgi:hypothetical protein